MSTQYRRIFIEVVARSDQALSNLRKVDLQLQGIQSRAVGGRTGVSSALSSIAPIPAAPVPAQVQRQEQQQRALPSIIAPIPIQQPRPTPAPVPAQTQAATPAPAPIPTARPAGPRTSPVRELIAAGSTGAIGAGLLGAGRFIPHIAAGTVAAGAFAGVTAGVTRSVELRGLFRELNTSVSSSIIQGRRGLDTALRAIGVEGGQRRLRGLPGEVVDRAVQSVTVQNLGTINGPPDPIQTAINSPPIFGGSLR